jgi:hypothetical protein
MDRPRADLLFPPALCAAGRSVELLVGGAATELLSQLLRRVHDQCLEMTDRLGAADDRAVAGNQHCFTVAAGPRGGGCSRDNASRQRGQRRAHRSWRRRGGLGGPVGRSRPTHSPCCSRNVVRPAPKLAAARDRPHASTRGVSVGDGEGRFVAHGVGGALQIVDDTASGGSTTTPTLLSRWV